MAFSSRRSLIAQCMLYILVLALLLLWFNAHGTQGENRLLATFPPYPQQFSSVRAFTQGVESWLSDRIGFRQVWLMPPRMLDTYVFNIPPSPMVTLGEKGAAYLQRHSPDDPAHKAIKKALGVDRPWTAVEQTHYATQKTLAAWAAKARLPVLFLAVPTSPVFRFDHLPESLRQSLKPNFDNLPLHAAVQRFQKDFPHAPTTFLYPLETGREVAQKWPVYPLKNFHWTWSPFTARVSEDIVRALGWPLRRPLQDDDFARCTTPSDLEYLVGFPFYNWDAVCPTPAFYADSALSSPALPPELVAKLAPMNNSPKAIAKVVVYQKNEAIPQGKLLVMGDSFTPALCLPLARNVREVMCVEYGEATRSGVDTRALMQTLHSVYAADALVILSHDGFTFDPSTGMPGMEVFEVSK